MEEIVGHLIVEGGMFGENRIGGGGEAIAFMGAKGEANDAIGNPSLQPFPHPALN
jgi:hypothetical protein